MPKNKRRSVEDDLIAKKNIKMVTIGDFDWNTTRDMLVFRLMDCEKEEDFHEIMGALYLAMGAKEDLERRRKKMGIKPLSEEDKRKLKNGK